MSGSASNSRKPSSSQSKITQTRWSSLGSRKTCEPLLPCCFRFSAPRVENALQKRSKSSILVVVKIISILPSSKVALPTAVSRENHRFRCEARLVQSGGFDPLDELERH